MADQFGGDDTFVLVLLLALADWDPEYIQFMAGRSGRLRDLLSRNPELQEMLYFRPYLGRRHAAEAAREVATDVLRGHDIANDKRLEELQRQVSNLDTRLNNTAASQQGNAVELHSFIAAASSGVDLRRVRMRRYAPARMYVTDPVPGRDVLDRLRTRLEEVAAAFGYEKSDDLPERKGSFFKDWWSKSKTKEVATSFQETAVVIKDGQVAKHGWMPQAEVDRICADAERIRADADKTRADADLLREQASKMRYEAEERVMAPIKALADELSALPGSGTVQHDRLIGIKTLDDSVERTIVLLLSDEMLMLILEDPTLIERPKELLERLRACGKLVVKGMTSKTRAVRSQPRLGDGEGARVVLEDAEDSDE